MCIYTYRILSEESKIYIFRGFIELKKMINEFLGHVDEVVAGLSEDEVKENNDVIMKILRTYAEALKDIDEIDKIIVATFIGEPGYTLNQAFQKGSGNP